MTKRITFSFGKNWQGFLKNFDEDRLKIAESSITEFLPANQIKNKSFLDIGCGSGLFSFAAFKIGAKKIVSFDVDPYSVLCCKYLRNKAQNPPNWETMNGSILNKDFILKLSKFDVVYSWGVLHHTGKMWKSIKNAASLVAPNGYLFITLYHKDIHLLGSKFWHMVKQLYNMLPKIGKLFLDSSLMLASIAVMIKRLQNPLKMIKEYRFKRGMDWKTDIKDWLGGYPFEYTNVDEVQYFFKKHFPKFSLIKVKPVTYVMALDWYLFKNTTSPQES